MIYLFLKMKDLKTSRLDIYVSLRIEYFSSSVIICVKM